jgi:hypothetical protein
MDHHGVMLLLRISLELSKNNLLTTVTLKLERRQSLAYSIILKLGITKNAITD